MHSFIRDKHEIRGVDEGQDRKEHSGSIQYLKIVLINAYIQIFDRINNDPESVYLTTSWKIVYYYNFILFKHEGHSDERLRCAPRCTIQDQSYRQSQSQDL